MTLEALQQEMYSAMKSGNKFRKEVISGLIADIKRVAIDKNCRDNITEEVVNTVLLKSCKMAQEMIDTCPPNRAETLHDYMIQAEIIKEFTPTIITNKNEILNEVVRLCASAGLKNEKSNRGAIMKVVSGNLRGKADMKIVNEVVSDWLR